MKYTITKGERALTWFVISNIPGVNRTDARVVTSISETLMLHEVLKVRFDESGQSAEYELSDLETAWLLEKIDKSFENQKVPPAMSAYALSLEEKLKAKE